jgi:peptide deformylase
MRMTRKHDRDAYKEFWLHFENDDAHFPLYPGQRTRVEYAYTVGEDKWGHWFQRAIRLPTRRLEVRLDFPAELRPVVWGMEGTLTTDASPLRTPVVEETDGDRATFEWSTEDPPLNTRFRLEWRFRAAHADRVPEQAAQSRPSEVMRAAGVVQRGAPVLERAARWFDLPDQAPLAEEIIDRLLDAVERIGHLHDFRHGLGLAAPQLGISWAAAVVRETGADPIVLLNPRIVGESVDHDEQYEGCLSFFDVRGLVSRPLLIEVEHADLTGNTTVTTFRQEAARLVAHEIDHLGGLLYADRMPGDGRLVPAAEFSPEAR